MSLWILMREFDDPRRPGKRAHEAIQWVFTTERQAADVLADPENGQMRLDGYRVCNMKDTPFAAQFGECLAHMKMVEEVKQKAQSL